MKNVIILLQDTHAHMYVIDCMCVRTYNMC